MHVLLLHDHSLLKSLQKNHTTFLKKLVILTDILNDLICFLLYFLGVVRLMSDIFDTVINDIL